MRSTLFGKNGCDVCVRNQAAVNAALAYLCHCSNYFSCYLDTKQSPKSLALGRETTRKTTMFGSLVLAEVPASLKKDCISRFEKATYLQPEFNSLGDVVCTVIGGQERFFVCKNFKIVSPLEWDVSLSPSILHFFDRMQPDVSIEDLSAKMSETLPSRIIEPVEYSNVKNVPSSGIHEHGRTKGCSVCCLFSINAIKLSNATYFKCNMLDKTMHLGSCLFLKSGMPVVLSAH